MDENSVWGGLGLILHLINLRGGHDYEEQQFLKEIFEVATEEIVLLETPAETYLWIQDQFQREVSEEEKISISERHRQCRREHVEAAKIVLKTFGRVPIDVDSAESLRETLEMPDNFFPECRGLILRRIMELEAAAAPKPPIEL